MKNIARLLILFFLIGNGAIYAHPDKVSSPGIFFKTAGGNSCFSDSTLVLIPFDYKQSALYHQFTYEVIDSVVTMLLKNKDITLSIDGYAHPDEGSDTICKYLALNRALFVRDYILGRGIDSGRIILVRGLSKAKSLNSDIDKKGHSRNCRAELRLNYPLPPEAVKIADRDEDGIGDTDDACPDIYGYKENNGCNDKNAVIIPFENQESSLSYFTYKVLDSVVALLKENGSYIITIEGHAYKTEGINAVCERLATERATIVKNYLRSRNIGDNRIVAVKSLGINRPYNAGKNPKEVSLNSRVQIILNK